MPDELVEIAAWLASMQAEAPQAPAAAISTLLAAAMEQAVANGANSVSMPDELVEIAAWLASMQAEAAPKGDTK